MSDQTDRDGRREVEDVGARLERHLSLLRSLINSTPDLIFYKDADGVYRGCNHAFEEFVDIAEADLVGRADHELFSQERADAFVASDREILASGEAAKFEEWVTYPDGRRVLLDTRKMPFFSDDGAFLGLIGISRDLTDRAIIEERLKDLAAHAERATQMKSAFLANMSHEIRTPMNGVLGMTELLLTTDLDPEQEQSARLIQSSAESLLRILDDILDFSKIEAGQLVLEESPIDLWAVVDEAVRVLASKAAAKGVELLIDIEPDVPRWALGDGVRLRQVVTNLTSNAVKFTDRGEVVVRVELGERSERSSVRVSVRDTGVGIPQNKIEAIFDEFRQADSSTTRTHGGTGLGLAISRRIVGLMGGRLHAESIEGEGSRFYFTLPVIETEQPAPQPAPPGLATLEGRRVIVVDDHPLNRAIARRVLERGGMVVTDAGSAVEAMGVLKSAGDAQQFDAAVVDFLMPEVDGFELIHALRDDPELRALPVVMLTSADRPGDAARARALGATYLVKPIAGGNLLRALAQIMAGAPPRPARAPERAVRALRILLAEDNRVNQMVARSLLEKRGHRLTVVGDGEQAVAAVAEGEYDLVLMDLQMPVLDGLEATRRIRALPVGGDLPVIALTAHALEADQKACAEAGMSGAITKPFKPQELYSAVESSVPGVVDPPPPADVERFRSLMRDAGAEEVVDETLRVYVSEASSRFEKLSAEVERGDGPAIEAVAHAIRSASLNIWATPLASLLYGVERAGADGDVERARDLLPAVGEALDAVVAHVSESLDEAE